MWTRWSREPWSSARRCSSCQDQFYGDRDGHIIDPFGHRWTIAKHVEDAAPQETMRRMTELQNPA
jgi:PhnB protein